MSTHPMGFCVVGVGGHARTKLIPAIAANGQRLDGLVSGQSPEHLPGAPVYPTIEAAAATLPLETIFLIASPPEAHFRQAMAAMRAGHDVLVEKPAFLTANEASAAAEHAGRQGTLLIEGFMHRHTRLFRALLDAWPALLPETAAIDIAFVVPGLPPNTFRQSPQIGASVLYDIGCYALSLLTDLGLNLGELSLTGIERPNGTDELLHLSDRSGAIAIGVRIGVGTAYENAVTLHRRDGVSLRYAPFFYGRPGQRTVTKTMPDGRSEAQTIADENGFETMLAVSREVWVADQPERSRAMIAIAACLERMGDELLAHRTAGG